MPGWKIFIVALVLSLAAPALLATHGVVDRDLWLVVFVASLLVGRVTGGYASHRPRRPRTWIVEPQRMP